MEALLILSLLSPVAELFPNLYLSWWAPANRDIRQYLKFWPLRVLTVLAVWLPILILLPASAVIQITIGILVFSAFGIRLYVFDTYLKKHLKQYSEADSVLFSNQEDLPTIPEYLYLTAFTMIGIVLYNNVPDTQWLVPIGILMIFAGAKMMGTFRMSDINLKADYAGRLIFTIGFLINLYNLYIGSSAALT